MTPDEIRNELYNIFDFARDQIETRGIYTGGDFSYILDAINNDKDTLLKEYLENECISDDTKSTIKDMILDDVEDDIVYHIKNDCIDDSTSLRDIQIITSDGLDDYDNVSKSIDTFFEKLEEGLEDYINSLPDDVDLEAVRLLYEME